LDKKDYSLIQTTKSGTKHLIKHKIPRIEFVRISLDFGVKKEIQ